MPVIPDQIRLMGRRWPDEIGYAVADGPSITFVAWDTDANRVGHALLDAGVERGEPVGLLFDDRDLLAYLAGYIGAQKAGAFAVLLDPRRPPDQLEELLDEVEPAALLVSGACAELAVAAGGWAARAKVAVATGADGPEPLQSWEAVVGAASPADPGVAVDDHDPADLLFTSGTTGRPKGLLARHRNATRTDIGEPDFSGDWFIHGSPLSSQSAQSLIVTPASLGMRGLYVPPPFDGERFVAAVRAHRPVAAFLPPALVEQVLTVDGLSPDDLESLRIVSVGNAPIAPETLGRLDEVLPKASPQNSYSLTELGPGYTMMPPDQLHERPGSVGTPVPPVEVRIVDPESGHERPPGGEGEIVARVGGQQREFFRRPDLEAEHWRHGWLHTGDLGRLDDDGFLYVTGRLDDLIVRAGHNVHAAEVEARLHELDGVEEVAAVGVPDDEVGEEIAVAVVVAPGGDLDEAAIDDWGRQHLGDGSRPRIIRIVDELPRTPNGKIRREELAEQFASLGGESPVR